MQYSVLISYGASRPRTYAAALSMAGAVPYAAYLPIYDERYDALVLAGGGDPDPACYGQANHGSHPPDHARDRAEFALFHAFRRAGKPILGICRGIQLINIALGGTLVQDMAGHSDPEGDLLHPVYNEPGSDMNLLYGSRCIVNSAHHQAIDCLAKDLRVTQRTADGVIEGVRHRTLPIIGVQWHPERLCGTYQRQDAIDTSAFFRRWVAGIGGKRPWVDCGKSI